MRAIQSSTGSCCKRYKRRKLMYSSCGCAAMHAASVSSFWLNSLFPSSPFSPSCFPFALLASSFVLLAALMISAAAAGSKVPAIFIFGDSIFDAGNNHFNKNCTAQADFPPYGSNYFHHPTGRFTNGRTVADFISQFIGIELQKPFLEAQIEVVNGTKEGYPSNGINFASAGSGVLRETNMDLGVIPLQVQLQQFEGLVKENKIDKKLVQQSIIFLESGSNDVFNYFIPFDTPQLDPNAYVQAMLVEVKSFIDKICKLGARRIAVFALGPVGCVPARTLLPGGPVNKCFGKMNRMVKDYNKGLESLVKDVPIKYPGTIGVYGAVYDIVQRFRAIPTRYGFMNTSSACCGDGTLRGMLQCGKEGYKICANPNQFLFWDYFHPSEHTYKLMSKALWGGRTSRIRPINLQTLANFTNNLH